MFNQNRISTQNINLLSFVLLKNIHYKLNQNCQIYLIDNIPYDSLNEAGNVIKNYILRHLPIWKLSYLNLYIIKNKYYGKCISYFTDLDSYHPWIFQSINQIIINILNLFVLKEINSYDISIINLSGNSFITTRDIIFRSGTGIQLVAKNQIILNSLLKSVKIMLKFSIEYTYLNYKYINNTNSIPYYNSIYKIEFNTNDKIETNLLFGKIYVYIFLNYDLNTNYILFNLIHVLQKLYPYYK